LEERKGCLQPGKLVGHEYRGATPARAIWCAAGMVVFVIRLVEFHDQGGTIHTAVTCRPEAFRGQLSGLPGEVADQKKAYVGDPFHGDYKNRGKL